MLPPGCQTLLVQWESDPDRAMEQLANRDHEIGLVAFDLGADRAGPDFVREAMNAGCALPLVLASPTGDDSEREADA